MKNIAISFLGLMTLFISACSDGGYEEVCACGTNGNLTLTFYPQHHGVTIYNQSTYRDTIFLKYGTTEFPGSRRDLFDAFFVGKPGEAFVKADGMKCGVYYVYGTGFDTSIVETVSGGIPFITEVKSGNLDITVPVTED